MKILLDVVHGRNRRVPRKISLRMLAVIAVLADKYQMVEVLESFSDSWIDKLKAKLEYITVEDERLIFRWMGISWVFGYSNLDNHGSGIVKTLAVPDAIMKRREEALCECYCLIEETIRRYQRAETLCPRPDGEHLRTACDSMLLGSLLKSASSKGLYPRPDAPYWRISFDDLAPILNGLYVRTLCDIDGDGPISTHGLKDLIEVKIGDIYDLLSGLDLEDFKN
ncbi:hypothetical protein IFR05_004324 [Cadophora sp. M221]|nr:hypothetical protein IFR05_004324 [Cadophora sp. M221]